MPRLIGNEAFEVTFESLEQFTYRGRIQLRAIGHGNQSQRMDLHLLSQDLYGADTGNLVTLLDAADVPSTRGQQHVFLHQPACRAQLAQRSTKVGLGWNTLSGGHPPDFRPTRPKRPRPTSLIDIKSPTEIQWLLKSRN